MRPSYLLTTTCLAGLLFACTNVPARPQAAASTPASAEPANPVPTAAGPAWPHETSDVRPDPAIRYGRLPNGMRYAIRQNKTPPGEAHMQLRFGSGSLSEADDQLGLAHFMEHMVFNGSRNAPEGEFVRRLERLGMQFGRDVNAGTGFDLTAYTFKLPDTRPEVVDTSLMLMREAAGEALLDPAAVDRERGIVLSEERTRDSANYRAGVAAHNFVLQGTLLTRRLPIGTIESLRNATGERMRAFYDAYYRPENAVFAAVGDFDPVEMERKVIARFSDWRGRGRAGPQPHIGSVPKRGMEIGTYVEAGAPSIVMLAWQKEPEVDPDTRAERQEELREQIALAVFNRRLGRLLLRDNVPFTEASAQSATAFKALTQTSINATYTGSGWRRALETIEQEQRRIIQHGVTKAELDQVIIGAREQYRNAVASTSTRSSGQLIEEIMGAVATDKVVRTREDAQAAFEATVATLTPEQVSAVLREMFQGYGPLIFVSSPQPIEGGELAVRQAFEGSTRVAVAPPAEIGVKPWTYTSFGTPGRVVERRELADLGTTFVRFANGVRLTVRPSQSARSQIQVNVRAGNGLLDLSPQRPSIEWAFRESLVEGGLGKMTAEEVTDALTGKSYGVGAGIDDDAFELGGSTRPADFATQMQVLAAFMTDPAWRTQAFERVKSTGASTHEVAASTPMGVLGRDLPRLLRSGDPRFGMTPLEAIQSATIADVRTAAAPLFEEPIEVIITGDTTVDEAIAQTAATLGALPPRRERSYPPASARTPFPAPTATPVTLRHGGRADQAFAYIAWPTDDEPSDLHKARAVSVLGSILRLRLQAEIREKQAVTYSPSVSSSASWAFPDYGYMSAGILAEPGRVDRFFIDTLTIARGLREAPVTQDELSRALGPMVESLETSREYNGYWSRALAGAQTDPRRLQDIREAVPGLRRITPADIQRVAQEYLREDRVYRVVILPEAKKSAGQGGTPRSSETLWQTHHPLDETGPAPAINPDACFPCREVRASRSSPGTRVYKALPPKQSGSELLRVSVRPLVISSKRK